MTSLTRAKTEYILASLQNASIYTEKINLIKFKQDQ